MIQVFSSVKATSSMMEQNLIFQQLYYTLKRLGDTKKLHHGNLKAFQLKNVLLLLLLINGTEV